ncbi:MAG: hypothetical protein MUF85_02225 [Patescibacteria group bacterium]|nr:hypothetical protein [Patescibacteria group bacterium]
MARLLAGLETMTLQKVGVGENCQWQFGNESSLANWFAKMKFGGRQR